MCQRSTSILGFALLWLWLVFVPHQVFAQTDDPSPSLLVHDFFDALELYPEPATAIKSAGHSINTKRWLEAFDKHKVSREFIQRRFGKLKAFYANKSFSNSSEWRQDFLKPFQNIVVRNNQKLFSPRLDQKELALRPLGLHAFRLDVNEDYDDNANDDIYLYFVMTHGEVVWGKATDIYRNLDEGESVFLSAKDRALFGPQGQFLIPTSTVLIDYGIVESDGEDIAELQRLSDAIIDLAGAALSIVVPESTGIVARVREETQNLMRLVISMDSDDRLVTDTIDLSQEHFSECIAASSVHEFFRSYDQETFWTHFNYTVGFRVLTE